MTDLRLYMFQCGSLKCKLHNIKMNQGLNEPYEIPVPWFLIQHPKGNVVIDGGNAVECVSDPYAHWGPITDVYYPVMTEEQGCVNELAPHGYRPNERFLRVVFSSAPRPHRRGGTLP
jgi:N-acyl homoserine lactone hydrolase